MTHKSEDYKISAGQYALCKGQTLLILMGILSHFKSSRRKGAYERQEQYIENNKTEIIGVK
jgi:hypothetical protein